MLSSLLMARGRGKKSKTNGKNIAQPIAKIKKLNVIKPTDSIVPTAAHLTNPAEATSSNFALDRHGGASLGKEKKERLSGFIFMCSSSTKYDCYQYRVFGLPMGKMAAVEKIKPGAKLFLFDFELKLLYGIYEATSAGQLNMEPAAFRGKFPVQVKFRIFKECLPLPESFLRHIIKENYRGSKFNQELNGQQVSNLLSSFHPLSTSSSQLAPPTLSNKPLSLSMPRAVTEDQFMYTSRLLALDNQYLSGRHYGHASPVVRPRPQIVPNVSFPQHVGQRTAAYVSHIQPNSDHQSLPVSCNYYVANAQEPYIPESLAHQNRYVANAQEPYIPEGSVKKSGSAQLEDQIPQKEVPEVTVIEEKEDSHATLSRKRKFSGTSGTAPATKASGEPESFPSEAQPLRQVRTGSYPHARVNRSWASFLDMYWDDLRLIGVDPSPLAGQVLRDVASKADADYVDSLGWSELVARSNSAMAEAALLNAGVTFRASNFRKQQVKDMKAFQANAADLDAKMVELQSMMEREAANCRRREKDMRMGFEAERLKLVNELRVTEVRLEAALSEAQKSKEEETLAQMEAELARAEMKKGGDSFKEAFLKSEEFGELLGDKALGFLNIGFRGCVEQFKAAGYPPEDASSDFISVDKVLDSLPPEM